MRALLRYHICMYASSFHFVLPFLLVLVYCMLLHVFFPILAPDCFVFSMTILFTGSLADGFYSHKIWSNDMDAVLILKTGSAVKYYLSKELFLSLIACIYALLIMLYAGASSDGLTKAVAEELIMASSLHVLVALLGYELGSLFHPQIIRKRIPAVILFLVTVVGIFMRPSLAEVPVLKYLFWIFPPVVKLIRLMYLSETCLSAEIRQIAAQLVLYISFVLAVKGFILSNRKWMVYE